jgi:hypothetical protein
MKRLFILALLAMIALPQGGIFATVPQNGSISGTVIGRIEEGGFKKFSNKSMVSMTAVPKNLDEFKQLESKVANTPQGAVTMMIVAISVLKENESEGKRCIDEICKNSKGSVEALKRSISAHEYYPRYFYKGAQSSNGYTPLSPNRIDVNADKASYSVDGQLTLYVQPGGEKGPMVPVTVKKFGNNYQITDYSHLAL